jgi:hypothetical protein
MKALFAAAALAATLSPAALADGRAPNAEEKAAIVDAMQTNGFSTWGKVELDDGKWEIDDAVHKDGLVYDVDLKSGDYAMIKKERDR